MNIRNFRTYSIAALVTITLGLLSRIQLVTLPEFVTLYIGDALWAMLIYWLVCVFRPNMSYRSQSVLALMVCYSVEFSQLYQAQWLIELRHTRLGGLVLGFGFLYSDLISYFLGILLALTINVRFIHPYVKQDNDK